ncbi:MAG: argininosuccinate lyase [Xanthomonadales bacterium]|nr:argininosuccinate lyase [Xanthomonadales bacterium]NIX12489.1 argininosuccinate lyase [Xanthomonadales bacterium]
MTDYVWKKTGQDAGPDEQVMEFLAGDDVRLDRELLPFDIRASAAHADGLREIGILDDDENRKIQAALETIAEEYRSGARVLDERFEDGHSAIEAWLTDMLGALGRKIHTGRSRNDQVAVALRLYLRQRLQDLSSLCADIAGCFLERAARDADIPVPGHTHLQKAMPSSAGLWLAGHAEAFIDNAEFSESVRSCIDASPLGTASGFGVNLPLAREKVARDLGFARLAVNPQYAQNARGKTELLALAALGAATLDLRRLAWDLSLFASGEFSYVKLPERYCTGSSIMPNKNNPDTVELLRATHAVVVGAQAELNEVLALPSGYHRDLQATKPPVLRAFAKGLQALALVPGLVSDFSWNEPALRRAIGPEMFATDRATQLAAEGVPFREAYRTVASDLENPLHTDPERSLRERVSDGACSRLRLDLLNGRLASIVKDSDS